MSKRGKLIFRHNVLDIQKTSIKNSEVCAKQGHFNTIEFQITSEGQKVNFFAKKCPIVVSVVFAISFS